MPFGPTKVAEKQLRVTVRERLDSGQLPLAISKTVYAGPGTNRVCAVCSEPITLKQIEYEQTVNCATSLVVHVHCHVEWQLECVDRMTADTARKWEQFSTHCRECQYLLETYADRVSEVSKILTELTPPGEAVPLDFWSKVRSVRAECLRAQKALSNHYASCERKRRAQDAARNSCGIPGKA